MRRLIIALVGAALLSGCGTAVPGTASPVAATIVPATRAPEPLPVPDPVGIEIPAIGVRASLVPTGYKGEGWEVPAKAAQPSWFEPGPEPGDPGAAVILGHVDLNGSPGVFQRLHELRAGDQIIVLRPEGEQVFEVFQVQGRPKDEFAPEVVQTQSGQPELRLITCGGELERTARGGRYLDNTIVSARPA